MSIVEIRGVMTFGPRVVLRSGSMKATNSPLMIPIV